MVQEELTKDDEKRVKRCDNYKMVKEIIHAHETFKNIELGEVFYLKHKQYSGDYRYVSRTYGGKKDKFVVFHKDDEGFIFIKRINASGKLGKEVQCLTTQYWNHEVEPDEDYVDALIFEEGDNYDPLKAEKALTKKKGQARRKNKKIELNYKSALEAMEYVESINVGDKLYDCTTTYGDNVVEWLVEAINRRPTDQTAPSYGRGPKGNLREDQRHNRESFGTVVEICMKAIHVPADRKWTNAKTKVYFYDFHDKRYDKYYKSKPFTTDDF